MTFDSSFTKSIVQDLEHDIKPSSWLSPYKNTSIIYMTIMLIFYSFAGIVISEMSYHIILIIDPEFEYPVYESSFSGLVLAGPLEETLYFGIPFYLFSGSSIPIIVSGLAWALMHIILIYDDNSFGFDVPTLFFIIPAFFFSYRTWISGKGWFSILSHSLWNIFVFLLVSTFPDLLNSEHMSYYYFDPNLSDVLLPLISSTVLIFIIYFLYNNKKMIHKFYATHNSYNNVSISLAILCSVLYVSAATAIGSATFEILDQISINIIIITAGISLIIFLKMLMDRKSWKEIFRF
ncbi:MAG: type II CAAX prenyl endopeptidase Rce1 family protein [Nitrososphaeraceae archaeon]